MSIENLSPIQLSSIEADSETLREMIDAYTEFEEHDLERIFATLLEENDV